MTEIAPKLTQGLSRSGTLVAAGLLVEALSLFWNHPTAFLLFVFVGAGLVVVGIALYFWTIIARA